MDESAKGELDALLADEASSKKSAPWALTPEQGDTQGDEKVNGENAAQASLAPTNQMKEQAPVSYFTPPAITKEVQSVPIL
jgi:hypothetical protein